MDFRQTVSAAIKDFSTHGFDSKIRLKKWQSLIKKAILKGLTKDIKKHSDKLLKQTYKKSVTNGGIARGIEIPAYKINKLRPALLRELNRHQLASAQLITSRRREVMETVFRRFTGWATSKPEGKTDNNELRELKKEFTKPIAQMPFIERRIMIDQNAKLSQNLNLVVGKGNDAIAVEWEAFPGRINYQHRKEHLARQGKIYVFKESWAINQGLIKKGPNPYYDDIDHCGELPYCSCEAVMLFNLDQLPDDLLTEKGREALKKG